MLEIINCIITLINMIFTVNFYVCFTQDFDMVSCPPEVRSEVFEIFINTFIIIMTITYNIINISIINISSKILKKVAP